MENSSGNEIILVQIAGLIARRIVCEVKENDEINLSWLSDNDRFGYEGNSSNERVVQPLKRENDNLENEITKSNRSLFPDSSSGSDEDGISIP